MTEGERLLDTNVLVHAYVRLDEKKQVTASGIVLPIWETGGGITTLQNLCEIFAVATKKVVREKRAPFWDALIAACMLENGIEIIVTENDRDFKRVPGITVTNPFRPMLRK
jgi:predicted nucleic acid-binding protein